MKKDKAAGLFRSLRLSVLFLLNFFPKSHLSLVSAPCCPRPSRSMFHSSPPEARSPRVSVRPHKYSKIRSCHTLSRSLLPDPITALPYAAKRLQFPDGRSPCALRRSHGAVHRSAGRSSRGIRSGNPQGSPGRSYSAPPAGGSTAPSGCTSAHNSRPSHRPGRVRSR